MTMSNKITYLLLFILLVIAFFLRSPMFLHGDFYLLPDQGRDLELVKSIVADHKMTLIGGHAGFGGLFHGPLWLYMMAPFFVLSGGNPYWTLIPLYLTISLGLIVGGYFIVSNLYGKIAGILF